MTAFKIKLGWFNQLILLALCFGASHYAYAVDVSASEPPHFLPTTAQDTRWVFSGVVSDEQGTQYGYFFQMDRHGNTFRSRSALFDVQTQKTLLQDESEAELANPTGHYWHVGHAFLQFNPISDSWVFGFKHADKAGFNFKVNMLKPAERVPKGQGLRAGIDVVVSQAYALNGHIYNEKAAKEVFVTAKHAWFREMAMTESLSNPHAVKGVLCRFEDDSAFYSVNLPEADALRGAMTGRFDAEGLSVPMSQFIHVEALSDGKWRIQVPSPSQNITIYSFLEQSSLIAGRAEFLGKTGFCLLSEDTIGHEEKASQTA